MKHVTSRPLCEHCRLRPVKRKGQRVCSRACANSMRLVPLAERFMRYYRPGKPNECWPWTGTRDRDGYGVIGDEKRRQLRAHRIAYERVRGHLTEDQYVLHSCDNPPCCNPAHLFVGTSIDNNADRHRKGRYAIGESHQMAKLTDQDVKDIRAMYPQMSQQAIADRYGVRQDTVSDIVRRVTWKHL